MRQCLAGVVVSFLLIGCGVDETQAPTEEVRVFVGETTSEDGEAVLVGVSVQGPNLRLFACGDVDMNPFTAWISTERAEDGTFDTQSPQTWQLEETSLSGTSFAGTIFNKDNLPFEFTATEVDPEGEGGLFSDGSPCETGLVVTDDGTEHGSCCIPGQTSESGSVRAQVVPLTPQQLIYPVRCQTTRIDLDPVVPTSP